MGHRATIFLFFGGQAEILFRWRASSFLVSFFQDDSQWKTPTTPDYDGDFLKGPLKISTTGRRGILWQLDFQTIRQKTTLKYLGTFLKIWF